MWLPVVGKGSDAIRGPGLKRIIPQQGFVDSDARTATLFAGGLDMAGSDCGEQFRMPGRRLTVGPGVAATERFRQKRVQRFDADYLIKAQNHSAGRNEAAAHLLALLSFLRNLQAIRADAAVEWDRAHVQAIKGDRYNDAAHRLPCQILIDRRYPWDLNPGPDVNMAGFVAGFRARFGDVWTLPKVFNAADSIAEASCLRGALVDACRSVVSNSKPKQRQAGVLKRGVGLNYGEILLRTADVAQPGAGIDRKAVGDAYLVWTNGSTAAFRRAAETVQSNGTTVLGQDCTDEVIYILERYIRFAADPPSLFSGNQLERLEESLWAQK